MHFDQMCISVLTTIHCTKISLKKAALIYKHRDTDLEDMLLSPFSKIIVVSSMLGPVSSPPMGACLDL